MHNFLLTAFSSFSFAYVQESKKLLEERFKTGKSRWFFTRLAF